MKNLNLEDPFAAGQMLGIMIGLKLKEDKDEDVVNKIQRNASMKLEESLKIPSEDVHLLVDQVIKETL